MSSATLHPGRACLACRRRKTKCDGVKPVCQRCARLGGECVYDPPERTPQTVRLQTRLRKLENELRSLSQRPSRISQRLQEYLSGEAQPRQRAVSPFIPLFPDGSSSSGTTGSRAAGSIVQLDLLDGYGTSLPRDELESALRMWDMQNAIPPVLSDYLIRIFLAFRLHFHFYMDIPTFLYYSRLPSSHRAIHPALMNAVYLAACSCAGGTFWDLESMFLERTRRQLEEALAFADRLTHFLWGNVILTSYYLRSGRSVEAQVAVSSIVQIAMAAGLHLDERTNYIQPTINLPPPDQIEALERKKLWHAIHMIDLTVASVCGSSFQVPANNFASFDNVVVITRTPTAIPSSSVILRSMSNCLFHAARVFSGQFRSTPPNLRMDGIWAQFTTISEAVRTLRNALPAPSDPRGTEPLETIGRTNPEIVHAHIELQAATILLSNAVMDVPEFSNSSNAALEAASSSATVMKQASGEGGVLTAIQAPVSLLPCLFIACETLVRDIGRSQSNSPSAQDQTFRQVSVEQDLESLVDVLLEVTAFYPAWIGWAQKLRDLVQSIDSFA